MTDAEVFASTLHLTPDDLIAFDWTGYVVTDTGFVMAETMRSEQHDGFVHYTVAARGSSSRSNRPVAPFVVGVALDQLLAPVSLTCADLKWKKSDGQRQDWEPKPVTTASVYFIQAVAGGLVKIGVSGNPERRLADFQTGCPVELRIVKSIDSVSRATETELHRHFGQFRVRGEWFDPIVLSMELPA